MGRVLEIVRQETVMQEIVIFFEQYDETASAARPIATPATAKPGLLLPGLWTWSRDYAISQTAKNRSKFGPGVTEM